MLKLQNNSYGSYVVSRSLYLQPRNNLTLIYEPMFLCKLHDTFNRITICSMEVAEVANYGTSFVRVSPKIKTNQKTKLQLHQA